MAKDYEVGYRKPPKNTRFRKGRSGNPKGRPKGHKNISTIMKDLMDRTVTIKQNGQERRVPFNEAFVHRLAGRSLDGSPRDMIALMKAIHDYMPEVLKADDRTTVINVNFVDSDGHGRPADKSQWKDCTPGSHAHESYLEERKQRDKDHDAITAWKASGLADEDDEPPGK
jgi:hypothetical protein